MTINRLDALLILQSRKALPKLPLLRGLSLCCHEGFLIGINVLAETTSGKSPLRVLRIFRVKPSNLADKPESFVNRHGLLRRQWLPLPMWLKWNQYLNDLPRFLGFIP
jgi:hypothetical protein